MHKYDEVLFEKGGCKVTLATMEHAEYVAKNMRAIDVLEAKCVGHTPLEAVTTGLKSDDITLTGFDKEGNPACIMGAGVCEIPYIWLLGTDSIEKHSYVFLKMSRDIIKFLAKPYGVVSNFVHKDNLISRRWLTFCNAEFVDEISMDNQPFYQFKIKY